MTCKNCFVEFDSRFCPSCGQKADVHRLTVGHVMHEALHSVTHADKGLLLLVKKLLTKPGIVAREYVEGRRKAYFNPLTFLVIASALFYYFDSVTGYMDAIMRGSGRAGGTQRPSAEMMEVFGIVKHSGKWLTLLFIAPLSAALSWIFFYGKKFNYAEHFILHALIFGEAALFRLVVIIPLYLIFPDKGSLLTYTVYEPVFIIYLIVAYYQFFKQRIVFVTIKAILIRILFVAFYWALLYLYVAVKGLIFGH
jgi:hypothetical protein